MKKRNEDKEKYENENYKGNEEEIKEEIHWRQKKKKEKHGKIEREV